MKIHTQNQDTINGIGKPVKALTIFLDTEKTGVPEKDTYNCAISFGEKSPIEDPDFILNLLIPALSSLIYTAYGEDHYSLRQKPITSINQTGFDPTCVNGVKGCKLK